MTRVTANDDTIFGRRFPGGIRFRTLCARCNNGLGALEDRALIDFYERVTKIVESPFRLPALMRVPAKPNLIVRDLLAHMVSANDTGVPSPFDREARDIFFGKRSLRLGSWNLFYWVYAGEEMFLARSLFLTTWTPRVDVEEMFILKAFPLALLFVRKSAFYGLPNLIQFIRSRDEEEAELPLFVYRRENHPVWPAYTSNTNSIMFGSNAFGLVAQRG
jgi:hypothetical protein